MAEHYPNSLFELLGVSKEEGLRAIKRSNLNGYQLNILYKRWGDDFDGTKRDPKEKLLSHEVRDLSKVVLPLLRSKINLINNPYKNPVIIEHKEEVNKYIGEGQSIDNCIAINFPEYNFWQIKPVILNLLKRNNPNFTRYTILDDFIKNNRQLILETFDKFAIIKQEPSKLEMLKQDDILFKILEIIRDKYYPGILLENLILSAKIAMIKKGIKSYDNCISLMGCLLDERFSVFRILKLEIYKNSFNTITSVLYKTNEEGISFLDLTQFVELYYNGLDSGCDKDEVIDALAKHFIISKKLVIEILEYQIPNFKLTSGGGERLK